MTTLSDLRILDLSTSPAGAYCSGIFASYGADVIMIEPPAGSPLRNEAPPAWKALSASKHSLTLDIYTASGRSIFRRLVEGANAVIETFQSGYLDSIALGFSDLHGIKRRIILTSVTGDAGKSAYIAGINAFTATAIAAHNADAYEVPQHIEIDAGECLSAAITDGTVESLTPGDMLFEMSEVAFEAGPPPSLGEHTTSILCDELGLNPRDLRVLRAAGAI